MVHGSGLRAQAQIEDRFDELAATLEKKICRRGIMVLVRQNQRRTSLNEYAVCPHS